jgi:hypothetical protein
MTYFEENLINQLFSSSTAILNTYQCVYLVIDVPAVRQLRQGSTQVTILPRLDVLITNIAMPI